MALKKRDGLGRSAAIMEIRRKMARQINACILDPLTEQEEKSLATTVTDSADYGQLRRAGNERQLESIKKVLSGYVFNEHVVVEGAKLDFDGKVKKVAVDRFEVMMKAARLYLETINVQNKLWGLYSTEGESHGQPPPAKLVAAHMVDELRRIASKGNLALKDSESQPANNRASATQPGA